MKKYLQQQKLFKVTQPVLQYKNTYIYNSRNYLRLLNKCAFIIPYSIYNSRNYLRLLNCGGCKQGKLYGNLQQQKLFKVTQLSCSPSTVWYLQQQKLFKVTQPYLSKVSRNNLQQQKLFKVTQLIVLDFTEVHLQQQKLFKVTQPFV